jgi:hypothetical protein
MDNNGLIFHRTLVAGSKRHHRFKMGPLRCWGIVAEAVWGCVSEVAFEIT